MVARLSTAPRLSTSSATLISGSAMTAPKTRVEDWRPGRLLTDLLDAEGGYLAPLLG